jgi:hypothetical protein
LFVLLFTEFSFKANKEVVLGEEGKKGTVEKQQPKAFAKEGFLLLFVVDKKIANITR